MTDLEKTELRLETLLEQNKEIIAGLKDIRETLKANANAQQLALEWRLKKTFPVYLKRPEYPRIKEG